MLLENQGPQVTTSSICGRRLCTKHLPLQLGLLNKTSLPGRDIRQHPREAHIVITPMNFSIARLRPDYDQCQTYVRHICCASFMLD